jgi:hypothetical protein
LGVLHHGLPAVKGTPTYAGPQPRLSGSSSDGNDAHSAIQLVLVRKLLLHRDRVSLGREETDTIG